MHRMLRRQLQRHFGAGAGADSIDDPRVRAFIGDVDAAYREADDARELLERALELTSEELFERNQTLHEAMSGADIGTWALDAWAKQIMLQGFPLPCVPDIHRRMVVAFDVFLAAIDAEDRDGVVAALAAGIQERAAVRCWVEDERGRRWLELRGRRASPTAGYLGICTDITHEHDALQQRRTLRTVIDTAPQLIFAKDRDGRFTLANAATAAIYGCTVDQLVGKTDVDFNANVDEIEAFRREDQAVIDSLTERFIPEERVTDAAGRTHWFQTVKRPLLAPDGRSHQVLGVATDITERRRAEAERQRLEDDLRQAQRLESLGMLAAGVAHDFNNLLTPMMIYAGMIEEEVDGRDPTVRGYAEEIREAAERARDLTAQLLAVGRKQTLSMTHVDLNAEIEELRSMLSRVLPAHIEIHTDLEPAVSTVLADRTQIHQILMNLAVNARDAMPEGGRLRVSTRVDHARNQVVMTVADTGVGMDDHTRAKIFEPFFTTKPLGRGTGLGLATVYGVVQQHKGTIDVESSLGAGTAFVVRLPAAAPPAPEASRAAPQRVERGGRATVLVCEDDPRVLRLVTNLLSSRALEVLSAAHPEQALAQARAHHGAIDLLLADVMMPAMNGPELYARLVTERGAVRVLYMTGYAQDALGHGGRVVGAGYILRKPFTAADFVKVVEEVLATEPPSTSDADGRLERHALCARRR